MDPALVRPSAIVLNLPLLTRPTAFMHNHQKQSLSTISSSFRTPERRVPSPVASAFDIELPSLFVLPEQQRRAQLRPKNLPLYENSEFSLPAQVVEKSQFDAYSDEGRIDIERRLGMLKRFGRKLTNVFRHLCKA